MADLFQVEVQAAAVPFRLGHHGAVPSRPEQHMAAPFRFGVQAVVLPEQQRPRLYAPAPFRPGHHAVIVSETSRLKPHAAAT